MRSMFHTAAAVHDTGCQLMQTGRLFQGGNEYPHVGCVQTKVMGPKGDLPSHGPAAAPDRQHRRHGISVTPIVPGLMRTGSHIRAKFKGNRENEYRWFSLGASLPAVSMSATHAAYLIVKAAGSARRNLFTLGTRSWRLRSTRRF